MNNEKVFSGLISLSGNNIGFEAKFKKGMNVIYIYSPEESDSPKNIPLLNNKDPRYLSFYISQVKIN
jgi:hypothetical protein